MITTSRTRFPTPVGRAPLPWSAPAGSTLLGAMGDLFCLDAASGKVLWSKNFPKDYKAPVPLWGFAAHPLLDGDKLICLVGGKGSVVVAFDPMTGQEKWKSLSFENDATELGYCPPVIFKVGGARQLIIWHPEAVNGLDPETGKLYWSQPFRIKANMAIATPRLDGDRLLVSSFYNGSMMLKLTGAAKPEATVLWQSRSRGEFPNQTDSLHSVMATPFIRAGYIYGICSYGQLRCVQAADGKRVWEDLRCHGQGRRGRRTLGQRVPGGPGRAPVPLQRERRPDHRPAVAERLRGAGPRPHHRTDRRRPEA